MGVYSTQGSVVVHRIRTGKAGKDSVSFYLTASPMNFTLDADGKLKGQTKAVIQAWHSIGGGSPVKASEGDVWLVIEAQKADGTSLDYPYSGPKTEYTLNINDYLPLGACKFLVTLYDGQAKQNYWDSLTITIGAQDAKDAVRLDLDNENDSILYDGTGTTKLSGDVITNATLYDGATALTGGDKVTFSIPEGGWSGCTGKQEGNKITVQTLSSVNASVTLHCYYTRTKQTYQAVFSVRKLLGTDKYDLVLSTKDVHYNETTKKVTAGSPVSVEVWRTPGNGGTRHLVGNLSTYGLSLSYSPTFTATYSSGASLTVTDAIAAANSEIAITLKRGTIVEDQETILIVKTTDGQNAVRLDLDNENDSILYDGTGTTKLSGNVISKAYLFYGAKDVSDDATYTVTPDSGITVSSGNSRNIVVTGMTVDKGAVTVKANYTDANGAKYEATTKLTLKRIVGGDKYDLILSPNAITQNTSRTYSSQSITISANRFTSDGKKTIGIALNSTTTGIYLAAYYHNGTSLAWRQVSSPFSVTNTIASKNDNILFELRRVISGKTYSVTDSTTYTVEDYETVPINHTEDGTSPFIADLSNEADLFGTDVSGKTVDTQYRTTKIHLFYGSAKQLLTQNPTVSLTYASSGSAVASTVAYASTLSGNNTTEGTVTIRINSGQTITDTIYVDITAKCALGSEVARFVLKPVKSGQNGVSPEIWQLAPDHDALSFARETDNSLSPSSISLKVYAEKTVGATTSKYTSAQTGITFKWGYDEETTAQGSDKAIGSEISVSNTTAASKRFVWIELYQSGVSGWIDRETIPITKDGQRGPSGDSVSYLLRMNTAKVTFNTNGTVERGLFEGYAYKVVNGTNYAIDMSKSSNYVRVRYNGSQTVTLNGNAETNGYFDDDGELDGKSITSQSIILELIVDNTLAYSLPMLILLPGADGYNYLPINNGPYSSGKTYTWNNEKRDFVDVEEDAGSGGKQWNRYGVARFGLTVPANTPPPNSSYWTKVQSNIPLLIANTIFGTNANIGGFLASSNRFLSSQIAYYVRYCGTYSSSTTYYYNTPSNYNAPRLDLVVYNEKYYVPASEGSLYNTVPTNTTYWRLATAEEIKVASGSLYDVQTMYKIELNGIDGIIRVLHADGYRWEVQKNGIQLLGNDAGRHLELDPANREIRIYNDNGELAVRMDGTTETQLSTVFGTETDKSASMTEGTGSRTKYGSWSGRTNETISVVIGTLTTSSAGRIRFAGTMKARSNYTSTGTTVWNDAWYETEEEFYDIPSRVYYNSNEYYWTNTINARLIVKNYADSTKKKQLSTSYVAWAWGYGGDKWNETSLAKDTTIPGGYHEIVIEYDVRLAASSAAYGSISWSSVTASFTADYYLSRIFANGLAFGSSAKNAFAVARNSSGNVEMRCATKNAEYGIEVTTNGVGTIFKDKVFRQTVVLGFGYITSRNNNGTHTGTWSRFTNGMRDDYNWPKITNLKEGVWKIEFTEKWKALGLSLSNLFVTVVPYYNNDRIRTAGLYTVDVSSGYCTIAAGDDDSPNTGIEFFVKFEYMLP